MSNAYTDKELNTEISVKLSMRDLIILQWGAEGVSWSDPENEAEWDAATDKIDEAKKQLAAKISAKRSI